MKMPFKFIMGGLLLGWSAIVAAAPYEKQTKWLEPQRTFIKNSPNAMPFFPHRANTTDNAVLNKADFDKPEICSACHQEIYAQWSQSVMAGSWEDPIYRAILKRASEATNGAVDNFCTGCHTPIGLTTGRINSKANRDPIEVTAVENPLPGVDCESCHNMTGRTGIDNGAYVLQPKLNGKRTKFGPYKDAVSPYHETVYSEFHTQSDFCGTCHNVTHPFSTTPIERTYDEWQESEYSFNDVQCQECHMKPFKGKAAITGPEREKVYSHWFTGGNATLLKTLGKDEGAERSVELMKTAGEISILDAPAKLAPGQDVSVKVKVQNKATGHKLPTGFPEGREMWIDFQVTDATGAVVYRLGAVKDGLTEPGTENYKVHLGDKDGHPVELEVWNVTHILSDNRLPANGWDVRTFHFEVPPTAKGPLKISAKLNYWPFPQKIVDELVGAGKIPVQIITMSTTESQVTLSSSRKVASTAKKTEVSQR